MLRGASGDTVEAIAQDMGMSVQKLKEQNREYIPDFTRLEGRFIVICNMQGVHGCRQPPIVIINAALIQQHCS